MADEAIDDIVLGQMLLEQGLVKQEQLDQAYKDVSGEKSLAAVLMESQVVTKEQIDAAGSEQTVKAVAATPPVNYEKTKVRPAAPAAADVPADVREMLKNPDYCFDKWVLLGMLGKGGMGEVWKAYQRDLKRYVAIKFLESREGVDLERFFREAQTAASLNHPNITSLYELNRHGDRYYIVMEMVDGVTLQRHMGKIPVPKAVKVVRQAAIALEYAHKSGIIHRDIKPQNIMVSKAGRVYVMDFGLAKQVKETEGATVAGMILGTPAYMSPEQTEGKPDRLDKRTDVYSLGATLYALVTGKSPASGPSVMATMQKVYAGDIPAPRQLNPKLPVELEAIIQKAMDRSPAARYQSCASFAEDLRRFLDGEPITAATPSFAKSLRHNLRRHSGVIAAVGVALLVMVVGVTAYLMAKGDGSGAAPKGNGNDTAKDDELKRKEAELARQKEEMEIRRELDRAQQAFLDAERVLVIEAEKWDKLKEQADLAFNEAASVLKKHPKAAEAVLLQGRSLALKLEYEPAEARLKAAVAESPHHEIAHRELGRLYWLWAEELDTWRTWTGQTASATGDALRQKAAEPLKRWSVLALDQQDRLLAEGLVHYVAKEYTKAEEKARAAIAKKPNRWEAHYLRAQALRRAGRASEAVADIQTAQKLQRSNPQVMLMAAGTYVHLYNHHPAFPILDGLLKLRPDFVPALCLKSQLLVRQNNAAEGLKVAEAAIKFAPLKPDGHVARGMSLTTLGRSEEAVKEFDEALRLDPKHGWAYALRAIPRLQRQDLDGALDDVARAIDIDPTSPEGYAQRATLRVAMRQIEEGLKDAAKAAELDAHFAAKHMELLIGLKRFKEAVQVGALYRDRMPNDYSLHLMVGQAQFESGDYLGAVDSLDRADELLGTFAPTLMWRGLAKFRLNRWRDATDDLRRCCDIDRAQGRPNGELLCLLAVCYQRLENWAAAVANFEQGFKARPELKKTEYGRSYDECLARKK